MRALISIVLIFIGQAGHGQVLTFPEIQVFISGSQFETLKQKGEKISLKNPTLLINDDTLVVKDIHSRGNSSLHFQHKSLSVALKKEHALMVNGEQKEMKRFDLINLIMDRNLWHNRWAFLTLSQIKLFFLINSYCTLRINGDQQGIYLLLEKPNAFASSVENPYMIRRGVGHRIDNEYTHLPESTAKAYKKLYEGIYKDLDHYRGEELFNRLSSKLEIENYFRWIAFNYLVMNGDYADELFLYIRPVSGKFDIIPWDYDDILLPAPHEGYAARNAVPGFKDKLIFSSEDALDRAIASDEYLYQKYLDSFRSLLDVLTAEVLQQAADQVIRELQAIAQDSGTAAASLYLEKEPFDLEKSISNIGQGSAYLVGRRNALLTQLKK